MVTKVAEEQRKYAVDAIFRRLADCGAYFATTNAANRNKAADIKSGNQLISSTYISTEKKAAKEASSIKTCTRRMTKSPAFGII